jgi:DNA-binding SARP family transcriptional activator
VGVGGPQQRRLLGVLLVHRDHVVSSERMADALWSADGAPGGASRSLPTYVSRLRSVLGDGRVVAQASGYRLDPGGDMCDADEFEALVADAEHSLPDRAIECYDQALSLWRGPAFGEFTAEWWALAESTRLGEMRLVAREQRAAALIAIGHHTGPPRRLTPIAVGGGLRGRVRARSRCRHRERRDGGTRPSADRDGTCAPPALPLAAESRTGGR